MVEPHSSNFRVITTNVLGVRIFRKFTVLNFTDVVTTKATYFFIFLSILMLALMRSLRPRTGMVSMVQIYLNYPGLNFFQNMSSVQSLLSLNQFHDVKYFSLFFTKINFAKVCHSNITVTCHALDVHVSSKLNVV